MDQEINNIRIEIIIRRNYVTDAASQVPPENVINLSPANVYAVSNALEEHAENGTDLSPANVGAVSNASEVHVENITDLSPGILGAVSNASEVHAENVTDLSPVNVYAVSNGSEVRAENVTDLSSENVGAISNASDRQRQDENVIKNKKQKITNVERENKKDTPTTEIKNLKKKGETHPPISEMVMTSIKSLRKRKGASLEDISRYMEENYSVNSKRQKERINRFLENSVESDVLEKVSGNDDEERFKIKKSEKVKKDEQNLLQKDGNKKLVKNAAKQKRQVKK